MFKNEYSKRVIRLTTITLPHFNYDVLVLYLADGKAYVPVRTLCEMLGLCAESHIPKWRKLIFWGGACKLPFRGSMKGTRIVWCIPVEQYPFIFGCLDWRLMPSEQRIQLRQAIDAWSEVSEQASQEIQAHYKHTQHLLFTFFAIFADAEASLSRYADLSPQSLDFEAAAQLDIMAHQGKRILFLPSAHARKMLQGRGEIPIVDAATIKVGIIETVSLPLLPVVSQEDSKQLSSIWRGSQYGC